MRENVGSAMKADAKGRQRRREERQGGRRKRKEETKVGRERPRKKEKTAGDRMRVVVVWITKAMVAVGAQGDNV